MNSGNLLRSNTIVLGSPKHNPFLLLHNHDKQLSIEHKLGGEDRGLLKVAENLGLLTGLLLAVA